MKWGKVDPMGMWRTTVVFAAVALALAGCSWVPNALNPVAWYRDLSGASKNDALDKTKENEKNLEAGGQEPYPNLADVPEAPSDATSRVDRDALQKSLIADRTNAQYTDEQLRAGEAPAVAAAPPPPAALAAASAAAPGQPSHDAAQQAAAAVPAESPLVSPTIPSVPQGEAPAAPPPPPNVGQAPAAASAPPQQTASLVPAKRRTAAVSQPVAAIAFSTGSTSLSDAERSRLGEIAALQHTQGGTLRIVGHAAEASDEAAQQKLESFTLALSRAKAVAQALAGDGVPQQAIAVEAVPSEPGDAAAGAAEVFLEH